VCLSKVNLILLKFDHIISVCNNGRLIKFDAALTIRVKRHDEVHLLLVPCVCGVAAAAAARANQYPRRGPSAGEDERCLFNIMKNGREDRARR
jgi:hypothetical protein